MGEPKPTAGSAASPLRRSLWQATKVTALAIHPAAVSLALFYEWLDAWPAVAIGFGLCLAFGWMTYLLTLMMPIAPASRLLATAAVVLVFWDGRILTERFGLPIASAGVLVLALFVGLVAQRLHRTGKTQLIANALVIFVVGLPLGQGVMAALAMADNNVATSTDVSAVRPVDGDEQDVFVVIFDGYPSNVTLLRDFDHDNASLRESLEATGFEVADFAWSAYSVTELSLGSALDLELKLGPGIEPSRGDVHGLFGLMGGDATLFRAFDSAGYDVHYIEGGWTGSRCRVSGFTCYSAPPFGEFAVNLAVNSVAYPLLGPEDLPWISGTKRAVQVITRLTTETAANGLNDLVFAHVVVPHEPWILDESCNLRAPGYVDENAAFLGHLECANTIMRTLAFGTVGQHASVLFMSDHGTSTRLQIGRPPGDWTDADIRERLTAFAALKTSAPCPTDLSTTMDAVSSLVTCTLTGIEGNDRRAVNLLTATDLPIEEVPITRIVAIEQCLLADPPDADC